MQSVTPGDSPRVVRVVLDDVKFSAMEQWTHGMVETQLRMPCMQRGWSRFMQWSGCADPLGLAETSCPRA